MNTPNHKPNSGFTLIEIMIVVTIIGILAGIAIPGLLSALDKSKQVSTTMLMRGFGEALEIYQMDTGSYPQTATAAQLMTYLRPISDSLRPNDEWKFQLDYRVNALADSYTVECFGKDGIPGIDITPATRYLFTLDIVYADGAFINGVE